VRRRHAIGTALVAVLTLATEVSVTQAAAAYRPTAPPPLCAGTLFADRIGSARADAFTAGPRPQRLWGMAGDDRLTGSSTRATCLFGGQGDDVLRLGAGGGVAYGEAGDDVISGGPLDDVLSGAAGRDVLRGRAGNDRLLGGRGVDALHGGPGDDWIDAADGRAEVVRCGSGHDRVDADGVDVLIGCEEARRTGPWLPTLTTRPHLAARGEIVRFRARVPRAAPAGAYRVLATSGCEPGRVLATLRRVGRPRTVRLGLRPPAGGWCAQQVTAVLVLRDRGGGGEAPRSASRRPPRRPPSGRWTRRCRSRRPPGPETRRSSARATR
jgi:hypothetical protein